MLNLFSTLMFIFTSLSAIMTTVIWSSFILIAALVKWVPLKIISIKATQFANKMMWCWSVSLKLILQITNPKLIWDVEGIDGLNIDGWYLLISNHKSWSDVVILCALFYKSIPQNKFFLKQQLLWVPFLGLACWALDMPFMKRYSRTFLLKNPHLRGQDIETIKKACEKLRSQPTTIVNFVEGSRFTKQKAESLNSPYRNLLPPKPAGVAFTLNALGQQFDKLLNVTIYYPENTNKPFIDLLSGKLKRVVVRVETQHISEEIRGDYFNDKIYKRKFQQWLNDVWQQKDNLLDQLNEQFFKNK